MILLRDLGFSRNGEALVTGATLQMHPGWKVGLTGANGCGKSSFLGLLRGEWPVLGKVDPWEREAWPVPVFVRRSVVSNTPKKVIYREPDFNIEAEILPCTEEEARQLPKDGILGYGAVEIRLTTLLTRE